jgi:hypothetical protein
MDSGRGTPPNWYADTPQLIFGHPPLIKFGSSLIKLGYHVNLCCLHLHHENQIIKI